MTNVYNKTEFERNSIQSVPEGFITDSASSLFKFLGSFWKNIHQGNSFIKGIQYVKGVKLAQFYLDLIENLKLQDRNGMPVFHRELWKPLIIRKSRRNEAQENILKLGGDIVLGEQPDTSPYGKVMLYLGRLANFENYVTYPVESPIKSISGITNNIINPTVVMEVGDGKDVYYTNGTLIFPKDKDPFASGSGFDPYDLPELLANPDSEPKEADQEVVLWASDVLIDKNYIADHMAYALGINCPSKDVVKRIINAGWDAINCSLTPEIFKVLLGALANIPVVQESEELVKSIVKTDAGTEVVTDKNRYTVYEAAKLRKCITQGAVLHRGDFLDESVKVYPVLTDVSESKLRGITEYADIIKEDVPVISVPKALIRAGTSNGIYVDWTPREVLSVGYTPRGHEKLFFELGGSKDDVDAFWEDVWEECDRTGVDLRDLMEKATVEEESSSDETWEVVPAKFFLEYLIGANTLIVTIDRSQLDDVSMLRDPIYFGLLNEVIPSGMRLFFIEHLKADEDSYDFEVNADDEAEDYAYDYVEDDFEYLDLPGLKGKSIPSYEDEVEIKFFRNRKRNSD